MPALQDQARSNPPLPTSAEPNPLLALFAQHRGVFFAIVAFFMVLSFNGQWRIGRDSAAYRGLGHQLATTGKYVFRDKQDVATYSDQQDTRYPGLPILLAGIEKLFGRHDAPAVLLIALTAVATLVLTFVLLRRAVPVWLAVAVVFGMGINGRFLEHANEILSDMPFLLSVVLTLYAFDRLLLSRAARPRLLAAGLLVLALLVCAAMRPTFWIVAVALAATCVWGLFRPVHHRPDVDPPADARWRRLACGLTLALLVLAAGVFVSAVDLRGRHAAGYEGKLRFRLNDFRQRVLGRLPRNAHDVLEETLPEAFFGTQLGPGFIPIGLGSGGKDRLGFGTLVSLMAIGAGVGLARRNVLWGMTVLVTVVTMAVIGSVPRYFIMILPLLLVGWGLYVAWVAGRFRDPGVQLILTFVGLGVLVIPNLISCLNLVREQRGLSRPKDGLKYVGFARAYHTGKWASVQDVARMIHDHVNPEQTVIGPEATVLTFLSDRDVFGLGMLLPRKDRKGLWERRLRGMQAKFAYVVFPDGTDKLYDDKDVVTGKMIRTGLLRPTRTVASAGGYKLSEYELVFPRRKRGASAKHDPIAATQPRRRGAAAATQNGSATTAPAERPRGRRSRATATTSPATGPSTAPVSTSSSRARRRRAAAAATQPSTPATAPATAPGR